MGMQGVFIDCVQDGDNIRCPGDGGYSQIILFGKPVRARKVFSAVATMAMSL